MKTKVTLLLPLTFVFLLLSPKITFCNETGYPLVTNYNSVIYKAHPQNWGIIQDDRGFMYFANGDGVLVYDGNSWELIELPNKVPARVFAKDSLGVIYVAGPSEFGYLEPDMYGKLGYVSLTDSIGVSNFGIVREINNINGVLYIRTEEYLISLDRNTFTHWKAKSVFCISFVYNNELFIQDEEHGLFKLVNDSLTLAPSGKEFIKKNFFVAKQLNSEVILANRIKGLYRYEPNSNKATKLIHIPSEANRILVNDFVFSGTISKNHEIILGTNSGGCVIVDRNGTIHSLITRETGILQNKIHNLYIDKDDNLWLALDKGISRCDYFGPVTFWNEQHNLEGTVETLIRFKGTLFIGTLQGLFCIKDKKIQKFHAGISQTWSFLSYKVPNSTDEILLVGTVEGIFMLENNELTRIPNTPVAYKIYQSPLSPNIIYFGSIENTGVAEYKNGKFTFLGLIPNTGNNVRSVEQEENGDIWISTFREGVIKVTPSENVLKPEKIEYFTISSGFSSLKNILIYRFNGKLVFATEDGLYHFNNETNRFYPEQTLRKVYKNNLKDIFSFIEDRYGNVFLSQLMNGNGFIGYLASQPNGGYTWNSEVFSKIPSMMLLVAYLEPDSNIWLGGSEGLFKVDLSKHQKYSNKFKTYLRNISISNDSCIFYGNFFTELDGKRVLSSTQNESLKYNINFRDNSITFQFATPEYSNESDLLHQCFLEGYSSKWTEWSSTTIKEYTNLREGDYCFKVRAKNIYGITGGESTFAFTIIPPWYRTTYAFISYAILSILIVFLIVKLSIRRLKNINIYLEKMVKERTEEINQQKEELQAQSEELLAQSEELAKNNFELEKLSVVASHTDNFVTILSPCGEIEWVNPAFTRFTGYNLMEIKEHKGITIFEASTFKGIMDVFNQCIETQNSIIYESSIISKSNETIWLQTTLTPIVNSEKNVTKVIAIDSNITDLKKAHQKTKSMLDEI
ncbi:MAG TPA: PAS domain-containing protein, partial [Tenuifilaceae bacterium]|nr:PAS domain-containing protein [Tenuifilaceae bacterium]